MSEQKVYELETTKIYTKGDRQRQIFLPRAMDVLVNSIKTVGQIQPGVCTKADGRLELVAGERRLRACETIGIKFKFILKEEVTDPYILERIQLEENLVREELTWQEEIFAKERIQKLLEKTEGFKTLRESADYLGIGKSMLHEDIQLAVWAREVPEVYAAPNKTTAKKIARRLGEAVRRDDVLEETFKNINRKTIAKLKELPTDTLEIDQAIEDIELSEEQTEGETPSVLSFQEEKLLYYDKRCLLGTMEERLLEFPDSYFQLVFFDPPWGVDYDKVKTDNPNQKNYEDSKEDFLEKFPVQLKLLYDKMAEDSHIYIFFGIVNYDFVYKTIAKVGFKTSGIPLLWHKKGAHRTRNPEYEYGRSYEPIAFARKGIKKLQGSPIADIILTPQPTAKIKDSHPSAKHPEIYKVLLRKSSYPGDRVLDPTAGSGMLGVAAEECRAELNLDWTQIEMDEDFRNLQLFNLLKGYYYFVADESVDNLDIESPKDFKSISIGSHLWRKFWKENPKQQDAMVAWRKSEMGI